MKSVVITKNGGPEVLRVEDRPDPSVGPGQMRIAVKASGINFADLMARTGIYPDAPPLPAVVGYEVAGEVETVGEGVEDFAVGDRVAAGTRFGGYSELATVEPSAAVKLPDRLSFEQGAAFPVNYSTAYAGIVLMGGLRKGDRLLIHAAAGGVGIAATQIAKGIGAEIYGTASASKHEAITAQGVDHPIDYRTKDFAEEVARLTGGDGVDVAMDAVGPSSFKRSYASLRPGGRLIMFGASEFQTGEKRNLPAALKGLLKMPLATMPWLNMQKMMNENKGVFGLHMLSWWDAEGLGRAIDPLVEGLESGALEPVIAESFPFEQAADAHRYLGEGRNIGKVVLTP
ncbi:medium chain dehydrogenase/reductase family protein [soil metagenome]